MNTDLSKLNDQQRDAVLQSINKNVVLLAGAGSGKTSTMVKRTEYLIADCGVKPEELMVVTFTNKAANEIKHRISNITNDYYKMWIGTFHGICVKILRMFGKSLHIDNFTILDQNEARKIMSLAMKENGLDTSPQEVKEMMARVGHYKNEVIRPDKVLQINSDDKDVAAVYKSYQNRLWKAKSFDFDNLIIYTILLLGNPDIKKWFHDNIHYIMVDEMQDSNRAQFMLINLIAQDNNIMMVGDVNQSIYGFRNARPELLNDFVNVHDNTIQLKLEKNYRSTKNIINAANKVVCNNSFGTKLEMFCDNNIGDKVQIHSSNTQFEEAQWILSEIQVDKQITGKSYSDYAIIYRANYQSRIIEDQFTREGIPYVVFGATSFYSRKETRDLLAYCKVVANPMDTEAFLRVLGTLSGVGKQTAEKIATMDKNSHDAIRKFVANPPGRITVKAMNAITNLAKIVTDSYNSCSEIVNAVINTTDYRKKFVGLHNQDAAESIEIIDEFVDMITSMENDDPSTGIIDMIDKISLLSDAKGADKEKQDAVKFMTAHASKGLEFDTVYVIGCEDGSFPHINALQSSNPKDSIEEERRLFYVAMTRAKQKLYITYSKSKMKKDVGMVSSNPSRFIAEIPEEFTENAI
jgi:DNA helicase-2/ATP-dependent DNA helicase PcrA